jgi:putative nucleotidyltransferase with HDIG domain
LGLIRNIRKGLTFLRRDLTVSPEDAAFASEYLSPAECQLFWRLSVQDQVHSIRVARTSLLSLADFPELDGRDVVRGALLHDIGKTQADLGIVFRTIWTLIAKVAPNALERLSARFGDARPGTLRHRMYVQARHAEIGADILADTGTDETVRALVRNTGLPMDCPREPADRLLLAADADRVLRRHS